MLQPLHDWVVLRPIEPKTEKTTASGLILQQDAGTNDLPRGEVLATGPGTYDYNGNLHPCGVNVGDIVVYTHNGIEQEINHEKIYLTHAASLIAIESGE